MLKLWRKSVLLFVGAVALACEEVDRRLKQMAQEASERLEKASERLEELGKTEAR